MEIIKVGDLTNEDYHARPEISKSSLDRIHKSIDHYEAPWKPPTDKMRMGTAFHTLILEPELFDAQFVQGTKLDGRTAEGKKEKKEIEENLKSGQDVLKYYDYENLMRMKEKKQHIYFI